MSGPGPDTRFDAFKLAARASSVSGTFDARRLPEVADSLAPGDDPVPIAWTVEGGASAEGRPSVSIDIEGVLPLVCQRCLDRKDWPVSQRTEVLLAHDEGELERLDAESENDVVLADQQLDAATLVEVELLLTLPFAPRHEGECPGRQ